MMNIYVLASYREGFPIGALEAQSMQKPVITTKETGCIDAIQDSITGLYTTHDPADIAQQIRSAYDHPEMGLNGRKWVAEHFDHTVIWKYIEELYKL
jgi:glycosyltransferase involved in cell wall biosynthesis